MTEARGMLDRWQSILGEDQIRPRLSVFLGLNLVTVYRRIENDNWTQAERMVLELIERMTDEERQRWWRTSEITAVHQ